MAFWNRPSTGNGSGGSPVGANGPLGPDSPGGAGRASGSSGSHSGSLPALLASDVGRAAVALWAGSEVQGRQVDIAAAGATELSESLRQTSVQAESIATSAEELASSANELAASIEE